MPHRSNQAEPEALTSMVSALAGCFLDRSVGLRSAAIQQSSPAPTEPAPARIAALTFDEPEFEPSYLGTANAGKSPFAWVFFTGRCKFSDVRIGVLRHGLRGAVYLAAAVVLAARSLISRSETIFDALDREGVRATFFGVFSLIDADADSAKYLPVFRAILARGHELGLHGYRHAPLSPADLDRSLALARERLGAELSTYSSPFGDDRPETADLLERRGFKGMRVWDANMPAGDREMRLVPYDHDLDRITRSRAPVVVINLHSGDCYPWGLRRVKRAIAQLKQEGYCFMTFGELCALPRT